LKKTMSCWRSHLTLALFAWVLQTQPAHADGNYVSVSAGTIYAPNQTFAGTAIEVDFDLGFQVGAIVTGYEFDSNWRAELEASFRRNELEVIEFLDDGRVLNTGTHDDLSAISVMTNAIYEFDLDIPFNPYFGAGLGITEVSYRITSHETGEKALDDSAVTGAYQFFAGVRIPISRQFSMSAEYRYWRSLDFKLTSEAGDPLKTNYTGHLALLNLAYQFGDGGDSVGASSGMAVPQTDSWYVDFNIGGAAAADTRIKDGLIDTNFDAFDVGAASTLAVGYALERPSGRRWRSEVELFYGQNDADLIDFGLVAGEFRLGGDVKVRAVSANFFYDFGEMIGLKPYVGIGLGYSNIDYDVSLQKNGETSDYVSDDSSGFATQALLGVSAQLSPQVETSLSYRYWWAPSVKLQAADGSPFETEHILHVLMLGIRFRLGSL